MHNLKTIKAHSLKAHLDRIQNTAEALAELAAGEALAGRLNSSGECSRLCVGLLAVKDSVTRQAEAIRGAILVDLEGMPQ